VYLRAAGAQPLVQVCQIDLPITAWNSARAAAECLGMPGQGGCCLQAATLLLTSFFFLRRRAAFKFQNGIPKVPNPRRPPAGGQARYPAFKPSTAGGFKLHGQQQTCADTEIRSSPRLLRHWHAPACGGQSLTVGAWLARGDHCQLDSEGHSELNWARQGQPERGCGYNAAGQIFQCWGFLLHCHRDADPAGRHGSGLKHATSFGAGPGSRSGFCQCRGKRNLNKPRLCL
jgi:hypothetical protein